MTASPAAAERPQVVTVPGVVECHTTVCVEYGGIPRWIRGGDIGDYADGIPPIRNRVLGMLFSDTHPLVMARKELFRPLELRVEELPQ